MLVSVFDVLFISVISSEMLMVKNQLASFSFLLFKNAVEVVWELIFISIKDNDLFRWWLKERLSMSCYVKVVFVLQKPSKIHAVPR